MKQDSIILSITYANIVSMLFSTSMS